MCYRIEVKFGAGLGMSRYECGMRNDVLKNKKKFDNFSCLENYSFVYLKNT